MRRSVRLPKIAFTVRLEEPDSIRFPPDVPETINLSRGDEVLVSVEKSQPLQKKKFRVERLELEEALGKIERLTKEISYRTLFEGKNYRLGLIKFRPRETPDPKMILHHDEDVICYVLSGEGFLRLPKKKLKLTPGTVCRIPSKTLHDFMAGDRGPMTLLYTMVEH